MLYREFYEIIEFDSEHYEVRETNGYSGYWDGQIFTSLQYAIEHIDYMDDAIKEASGE